MKDLHLTFMEHYNIHRPPGYYLVYPEVHINNILIGYTEQANTGGHDQKTLYNITLSSDSNLIISDVQNFPGTCLNVYRYFRCQTQNSDSNIQIEPGTPGISDSIGYFIKSNEDQNIMIYGEIQKSVDESYLWMKSANGYNWTGYGLFRETEDTNSRSYDDTSNLLDGDTPSRARSWWVGWKPTHAKKWQLKKDIKYAFIVGKANDNSTAYLPRIKWYFNRTT